MRFRVNQLEVDVPDSEADRHLLAYLRRTLNLTGAKSACGIGSCGACTVLLDNEPVRACVRRLRDCAGRHVVTIEGLTPADGTLHPLQQAFLDAGAVQCGYCTPGMVLAAHAFLLKHPRPTREQIRQALQHNICRCTGYQQIVDAVEQASAAYQKEQQA